MRIYPCKFHPIYKERIWGGRNLQRLFGRALPADMKVGESWELADLAGDSSILVNGPDAGTTLNDLTRRLGGDLLGRARPMADGRFPLLLKLLDAEDILSLQVHPDAAAAAAIGGDAAAKTECWYILESRGGFVYKGVLPGVTREQFAQAMQADTVERLVRKLNVSAGDFHYLPAGVVHALGPGVVLAEIQTPSDTTYRVTDWGRGREIHPEKSLQCIRFGLTGEPAPGARGDTLLATECFTVKKRSAGGAATWPFPSGRCTAVMVLGASGHAEIHHASAVEEALPVAAGDTVLLPAALANCTMSVQGAATWLEITLPEGP
ncbi:MAG: type I phosphomannose isomerase catalytic subunit [Phycisphaerae bacterium]|jgi:mannose-6-phosphate isomerase